MVFDTLLLVLQSMQLLLLSVDTAGIITSPPDGPPPPVPAAVPDAVPGSVPVAPAGLPPAGSLVLVAVIPEVNRVVVDSS